MLEIYFDGVLLDTDKYLGLTQKGKMFDKEFKLGGVMSREFKLTIPKADFDPNTKRVLIKYMSNDYAHLIIDKYTFNEGGIPTVDLTLVDKLVLADFNYDASSIVPTTTLGVLQDICNKIGVVLGNIDFPNNDIAVDFYDSTMTARQYISYIAEVSGGFARIEADGKLYIRGFSNKDASQGIVPELCEQILIGKKHCVERVVYDNGINKMEKILENATPTVVDGEYEYLETVYISGDNVYVNDEQTFENIANEILGFEYYDIDTGKTYILPNTMSGDVLKLTYENQDYYTIEQFEEISFLGSWQGSYKLQIDSGLQQETKVVGIGTQVKAIKVNLNRTNNTLQMAVSDIQTQKQTNNELFNQIQANQSLIEQTANSINQSVINLEGKVADDIDGVADDLSKLNEELTQQIITQQSLIQQLAESITSTIRQTGGNNLLRNSVGLAGVDFWEVDGNVISSQDSYTEYYSVSGSKFVLTGASSIKQDYITQPNVSYGVSFKIRHIINGTANPVYIRIHRTEDDYDDLLVGEEQTNGYSDFEEFNTYTYVAKANTPYIEIINTGDDILEITDLIISIGETQSWSGYHDEVYGKEHRLDKFGLKLTDLSTGDYSQHTTNALQFIDDGNVVAEISRTQVKSNVGKYENEIDLRKLQWIALDDDNVIEYIE